MVALRWQTVLPAAAGLGAGLLVAAAISELVRPAFTVPQIAGAQAVSAYLQRAGQVANINGNFVPFGLAVAWRESRFNNRAVNDSRSEANAACRGWERNKDSLYRNNPFGAQGFCWGSGGWYGLLPPSAMQPEVFRNLDPRVWIFDPAASTAMFTDFVHRIIRNYFPRLPPERRNYLSIRQAMASLETMFNPPTAAIARGDKLASDLKAVGADPAIRFERPRTGPYPGAAVVWENLRTLAA